MISPDDSVVPRLLALIPAYNEAERVGAVVTATRAYLPVLVVDDGSTDGTARLAEEAGATVLRQWPNQGKGAALRAGFRWALQAGYEAVIMLDADGQHDPAEIPSFLRLYSAQGADLLIGGAHLPPDAFPAQPVQYHRAMVVFVGAWSACARQSVRLSAAEPPHDGSDA